MTHDVVILIIAITIGVLAIIYGIHELKWTKEFTRQCETVNRQERTERK